jgi:hypothetical protein
MDCVRGLVADSPSFIFKQCKNKASYRKAPARTSKLRELCFLSNLNYKAFARAVSVLLRSGKARAPAEALFRISLVAGTIDVQAAPAPPTVSAKLSRVEESACVGVHTFHLREFSVNTDS